MTLHGLSFDVEDWEQNIRSKVLSVMGPASTSFRGQMKNLLDLCDDVDVRATFFVVGRVARDAPEVVREIAARGHEIGCHSDQHKLIWSLDRAAFHEDTRVAKNRLEEITGNRVVGYRAPEFSVSALDHWCFDVLTELGFAYDSSVFPVRGPRYGIPDAPRWPLQLKTKAGSLVELPLLTLKVFDVSVPAAGGTYYRVLPQRVLSGAVSRAEREGGTAILYFHPYEFADDGLWLRGDGWQNLRAARYVLAHNFQTKRVASRLRHVLRAHPFGILADISNHVSEGRLAS